MAIEYQETILRSDLKRNLDTHIYVFGDNMQSRGYGGQAREMRGEPNAVGIPTKWYPSNLPGSFFYDRDLHFVKKAIDARFDLLEKLFLTGKVIVWPSSGIGTGLARLREKAPLIWDYIETRRKNLENMES